MWLDINDTLVNFDQITKVYKNDRGDIVPAPAHIKPEILYSIDLINIGNNTIMIKFDSKEARDNAFDDMKLMLLNDV